MGFLPLNIIIGLLIMSSQKDKYKDYTYEDFLDDDLRKEYFKHLIMKELRRKDELRECAGNRGPKTAPRNLQARISSLQHSQTTPLQK